MSQKVNRLLSVWNNHPTNLRSTFKKKAYRHRMYESLAHIFCPGPFYFYVFNFAEKKIEYLHPTVEDVLGYSADELDFESIANLIHPIDIIHMQQCESKAGEFFHVFLDGPNIKKYKVNYCIRIQRKDGEYITILHQAVALELDPRHKILRSLGVHANIDHIVKVPNKFVSFVGLGKLRSYMQLDPTLNGFENQKGRTLTKRQLQVLGYLAEGYTVPEIAEILVISKDTVRTHRNNIRVKLECRNSAHVVSKAIRIGLI